MKYSMRTMNIITGLGLVEMIWAVVIIAMAIVLCFTKSLLIAKIMSSLAVFMAFFKIGLFYAGTKARLNEDDEVEI